MQYDLSEVDDSPRPLASHAKYDPHRQASSVKGRNDIDGDVATGFFFLYGTKTQGLCFQKFCFGSLIDDDEIVAVQALGLIPEASSEEALLLCADFATRSDDYFFRPIITGLKINLKESNFTKGLYLREAVLLNS